MWNTLWKRKRSSTKKGRRPKAPHNEFQTDLGADDLRTLRLQSTLTALAVLALAAILDLWFGQPKQKTVPTPLCPAGQYFDAFEQSCLSQKPATQVTSCETDELMSDGCECDGGRITDDAGRCVVDAAREQLNARCAEADRVIKKCAGGAASDCSPEVFFRKSAVDDDDLEALLSAFPGTFTIHFDNGEPRAPILGKSDLDKLSAQIRDLQPDIKESSTIILLARTDTTGDAASNDELALRRLGAVAQALELVAGVSAEEEADFQRKILRYRLDGRASMTIEAFRKRYTRIVDLQDARQAKSIDDRLAEHRAGKLSPNHQKSLKNALHRSVVVILVPAACSTVGEGD